MRLIKLTKKVFNGDLVKFYHKLKLVKKEEGRLVAKYEDVFCSQATGKLMQKTIKEWAKKQKENRYLRGKRLTQAVAWEWLGLGPTYDNSVPLGYIKVDDKVILPKFL